MLLILGGKVYMSIFLSKINLLLLLLILVFEKKDKNIWIIKSWWRIRILEDTFIVVTNTFICWKKGYFIYCSIESYVILQGRFQCVDNLSRVFSY